jgi:hypothetical protein
LKDAALNTPKFAGRIACRVVSENSSDLFPVSLRHLKSFSVAFPEELTELSANSSSLGTILSVLESTTYDSFASQS